LAEKVEPKGRQAPFIEEAGQGPVGRTVLAGEKSMAQHGETPRWSVRRAQHRGNTVPMAILKCQGFFHGMVFQSSKLRENYYRTLELRWSARVAQHENTPPG
jgi:hypothetical protein